MVFEDLRSSPNLLEKIHAKFVQYGMSVAKIATGNQIEEILNQTCPK